MGHGEYRREYRVVLYVLLLVHIIAARGEARDWNWQDERAGRASRGTVRFESLYYGDVPVLGVKRKFYKGVPLDANLGIESASIDESVWSESDRADRIRELEAQWRTPGSRAPADVRWDVRPVLTYSRQHRKVTPAWEATPSSTKIQFLYSKILEPRTGKMLEFRPKFRKISARVYDVSPLADDGASDRPADTRTLPTLVAETTISTSYAHVRRQIWTGAAFQSIEVDPNTNFYNGGSTPFEEDPDNYDSACSSTADDGCENQGFDAVNVFYHVENYRNRVDTLLTDIGETADFDDPVRVLVNAIGFDTNDDGDTEDEVNNAFYTTCNLDSASGPCLLFNPPEAANYVSCAAGTQQYFDLAREAIVAVHEYQHYITDTITGLASGDGIGDLLHEGYSDYFAVSQVTRLSGRSATTVLDYGFQNCPVIQRAIGSLKVFDNTSSRTDPHFYGWTWASGLYDLNVRLGSDIVDKIALKSLFYIPTTPSYVDAVEALVRADEALYSGEHKVAIRQLFYDQLRFVGGNPSPFSDFENRIASMGVSSCLSTPMGAKTASGLASLSAALLWICGLLIGVRRWRGQS